MDTETMIRELQLLAEKYKNDFVCTGEIQWKDLCEDVANRLQFQLQTIKKHDELNNCLAKGSFGDFSDGYHTFNELYHHRAVLFSAICNQNPLCSCKAKKHHDGTMYDGMFIVGINTPEGQATYHYDIEPYWDMFQVPAADLAPEWDGHTADEAIRRIGLLAKDNL